MCFLKNIQLPRHGKMDGHIRIPDTKKRRILLFSKHAALANTVAPEKTQTGC